MDRGFENVLIAIGASGCLLVLRCFGNFLYQVKPPYWLEMSWI
jgi:hypothetical protein